METLLHVAARRNLVLFIGLLLAHPGVDVEYAAKHRLVARRDGLSTIAVVEPVPSQMPTPLEACEVPLTVELLVLKSHDPLGTFRRNRKLCVGKLASLTSRLPRLFGPDGGAFHEEVPAVLRDDDIPTEHRIAVAPYCPVDALFHCIDSCRDAALTSTLCGVLLTATDAESETVDAAAAAELCAKPPSEELRAAAAAAATGYTRVVTTRLAVSLTLLVRSGRVECAAAVVDSLGITVDVMHWQDAAHFRKERRAAVAREERKQAEDSTPDKAHPAAMARLSERAKRAGVGAA
eukprot:CAMPEP_0174882410 /NCGR_PEP_ID=MMETSP1114-20130205/84749_1 /TAXON_ID=312471 /ORGANISM="Neobodo designis, Strain CCAP 1951/1" /LENGTH=291 /DNA_ID=CAMNT_0016117807 /DNA_START=28 /DNA_END=899 /DNA_ORIENTATION=-